MSNVEAAVEQAVKMFWHGPDHPKARPQFQSIVESNPDHLVSQWFLFQCELIDGDIAAANARGEVLMRLSPGSPVMLLSHVRALVAAGDIGAARAAIDRHPLSRSAVFDRRNLSNNEIAMVVALQLAGEPDRSFAMSRAMCREDGVPLADWSQVENAVEVKATLAHMSERVGGRDICIFGRGPSMRELETAAEALRERDFVPFVINEFQDVAANILARAGKRPGLVSMTSFEVLRACASDLRTLCDSDGFIGLSLPLFVRRLLEEMPSESDLASALQARRHQIFSYTCEGELNCPIPLRPLDFPIVNTLLHALGTAVLLKPRRIFLFGFDQGGNAETGEYYYAEHLKDAGLEKGWQSRTERWLRWDAFRVSHLAPCFVNHLHMLHDVDYPLIYNVCKHSAITCFPRIELDDYLALDRGDA